MNKQIEVPYCHLPNSEVQTFDMSTCKRSLFQIQTLQDIANRDDFAHFVAVQDTTGSFIMWPEFKGPANVMWYDKSGSLHLFRIGANRILRTLESSITPNTKYDDRSQNIMAVLNMKDHYCSRKK